MPKKIVGLMGACGAGKTTVGEAWLNNYHTSDYKFLNFADPLKRLAFENGWSGKKDDEGRAWLQDFSERYKKIHGEMVFFDLAIEEGLASPGEVLCFGDTRFYHEIRQFIAWQHAGQDARLVYIFNPDAERRWTVAYKNWFETGEDKFKWAVHRSEFCWRDFIRHAHGVLRIDNKPDCTSIEQAAAGLERLVVDVHVQTARLHVGF
jgi:hypothetical protein